MDYLSNTDIDYKSLGAKLKKIRKLNNLTQEKLSEIVGASTNFIAKIESSNSKVGLKTLYKICNSLNISMDYLLGLDDYGKEKSEVDILFDNFIKHMSIEEKILTINILKEIQAYNINSYKKRTE